MRGRKTEYQAKQRGKETNIERVQIKRKIHVFSIERGRIHDSISRVSWAGVIMEVSTPFGEKSKA